MLGMRERIAMVGGAVEVHATPGGGTQIIAVAPFPHVASPNHAGQHANGDGA